MSNATSAYCRTSLDEHIGWAIALSYVGLTGLLSAIACAVTLLMMARCIWKLRSFRRWIERLVPLDILIASIIFSDLIQGIAGALNYRWVVNLNGVIGPSIGSLCSAQGALKILGESTSAIGTLAITVLTFLGIFFRRRFKTKKITLAIVVFAWLYALVYTVALLVKDRYDHRGEDCTGDQDTTDRFFAPLPFWCWINFSQRPHQIASEYAWLWSAGLASIVLWVPLFIIQRTRRLWPFLVYPVAYTIIVLPLSIVRFQYFKERDSVSEEANLATQILFHSLGWVNVLLFFLTRRTNLIYWREDEDDEEKMGVEMDDM